MQPAAQTPCNHHNSHALFPAAVCLLLCLQVCKDVQLLKHMVARGVLAKHTTCARLISLPCLAELGNLMGWSQEVITAIHQTRLTSSSYINQVLASQQAMVQGDEVSGCWQLGFM